jgi:dolichol-phosphate mannosyltransferase
VGGDGKAALTIVIPTYNERANVDALFNEFAHLNEPWPIPFDILIVDDGSPDGTREAAYNLARRYGLEVRVHVRSGSRGLGTAIVAGLNLCDTDLVCAMDADLSHPPILIPMLFERLNGFDGTVASRYAVGGRIADWSFHRKIISRVATRIAKSALDIRCADPLSGFFLFRAASVRGTKITGLGNKPLLEILSRNGLGIFEVPYEFRNRAAGESKLTIRAILEFILLVLRLRWADRGPLASPKDPIETSVAPTRNS